MRSTIKKHVPLKESILLGLIHVLIMNVFVIPALIAGGLGLTGDMVTRLIQSAFLGAGVATLIQVLFFHKLPISNGGSFIPLGAIFGIYHTTGSLDTVFGAFFISALLIIGLGLSGVYKWLTQRFVPLLVSGTVIMVIGLALIPTAFTNNIFVTTPLLTLNQNVLLTTVTAITLVITSTIGNYIPSLKRLSQYGSVVIALIVGTGVAHFMGGVDWSLVRQAHWLSRPLFAFVDYGMTFDPSAIVTMFIIQLIVLIEATSGWLAVSAVANEPLDDARINRGVLGEGVSNAVLALIGSSPNAGYSSNAGVISITGVADINVFKAMGAWFVAFGFLGKFSAILNAIPSSVIGGIFIVACVQIFFAGLNVVRDELQTDRAVYIVGLSFVMVLGVVLAPQALIEQAPTTVQYFLNSPIAVGAITAIIANALIPERKISPQE